MIHSSTYTSRHVQYPTTKAADIQVITALARLPHFRTYKT
jgi:hypothetical protein